MAVIHHTTLTPGKMELLAAWLPSQSWYRGRGRAPELAKAGGFRLDDPDGEVGIEFMVVTDAATATTYHVPLTYRAQACAEAARGPITTAEHGVLGRRWIYDGTHDPILAAQLVALVQGEAEPQAQSESHTPDPTVTTGPPAADTSLTVSGAPPWPARGSGPSFRCRWQAAARSCSGSTGSCGLATATATLRACPRPGASPAAPRLAACSSPPSTALRDVPRSERCWPSERRSTIAGWPWAST